MKTWIKLILSLLFIACSADIEPNSRISSSENIEAEERLINSPFNELNVDYKTYSINNSRDKRRQLLLLFFR